MKDRKYLIFIAPLLFAYAISNCGEMRTAFPFVFLSLSVGFIAWSYLIFHSLHQASHCDQMPELGTSFCDLESFEKENLSNAYKWILGEFLTSCVLIGIYYYLATSLTYHLKASLILGGLAVIDVFLISFTFRHAIEREESKASIYETKEASKPLIITSLFALAVSCLTWLTIMNISLVVADKTYYRDIFVIQSKIKGESPSKTKVLFESYEDLIALAEECYSPKPEVSTITKNVLDLLPILSGYNYLGGAKYDDNFDVWMKVSSEDYLKITDTDCKYRGNLIVRIGYYDTFNCDSYRIYKAQEDDYVMPIEAE